MRGLSARNSLQGILSARQPESFFQTRSPVGNQDERLARLQPGPEELRDTSGAHARQITPAQGLIIRLQGPTKSVRL